MICIKRPRGVNLIYFRLKDILNVADKVVKFSSELDKIVLPAHGLPPSQLQSLFFFIQNYVSLGQSQVVLSGPIMNAPVPELPKRRPETRSNK